MAYNDVVNAISNTITDANTLENVINGAPNIQFKSRLGRYIWTLATIGYKIELVNQQANAAINAMDSNKTLTTQTANAAMFDINAARDNVQNLLDAKLNDMGNAIDSVAAVKAQENGWTALLVADESGMTQQQVNDKIALFYNTVADMVADTKLKAGKAVITHGYYTPNDGGGARYLIKDTATDYSIPIANNLHAVFADSFDIRRFGIRNSATLDQTTEIQRMVNYADTRVYEIDFLNFSLMTPKTVADVGLRGMGFNYVHKLKNLTISNDKTKTLQQGDCCIHFLPKSDGFGTFELSNVTFDPFVAQYNIISGSNDGYMHGFSAQWHSSMPIKWPQNQQFMTGYSFVFDGINFVSPAVSYNLLVGIWSPEVRISNAKGEYWAIYLCYFADKFYAENVHGIFRDDLHTAANPQRLLVTNLFQEEQEVGGGDFAYTQTSQTFKNISCYKHSDKSVHTAVKRQVTGNPTLDKYYFENVIGLINIHDFVNPYRFLVKEIEVYNCSYFQIGTYRFNDIKIYNSIIKTWLSHTDNSDSGTVTLTDCTIDSVNIIYAAKLSKLVLNNCTINNKVVESSTVNQVLINGGVANYGRIIQGYCSSINCTNLSIKSDYDNLFLVANEAGTLITVNMLSCPCDGYSLYGAPLISVADSQSSVIANINGNIFRAVPKFNLGNAGVLNYENNTPTISVTHTYDPSSLATATQQSTAFSFPGSKIGDNVSVSFNQPLQGTRLWAEVTADNQVTVYHRNDTGAAVDLPSGTLTVKIV